MSAAPVLYGALSAPLVHFSEGLRLRDLAAIFSLVQLLCQWKSRVDESIHRGTNFDTGGSYDNRNTPNRCHSKPHFVIDLSLLSSQRITEARQTRTTGCV